jgi:hypothetical protein
MNAKRTVAMIAVGAAMLAVPTAALASSTPRTVQAPASALNATTSDLQIALKPSAAFPRATGSAQYQSQPGQREFQVEVEHLLNLTGRYVLVQANGTNIGWSKVSSTGIAQLSRNTEVGQRVPWIVHGSTVKIKTSSGVLIASGVF